MSSPVNAAAAPTSPTNPFHISRAYQVPGATRSALVTPAEALKQAAQPGGTNSLTNTATRRIVAGMVPGKIDFSGPTPTQTTSAIPMYRHPADKNAAATAVDAGRVIDVEG